ncbi:MAG TPA: hypothetical protein VM099_10580 [Gemmatimonadaceae bacterium]|nr:hypothetical protein [Gemmatimonadaceae bacterium]
MTVELVDVSLVTAGVFLGASLQPALNTTKMALETKENTRTKVIDGNLCPKSFTRRGNVL